MAQPLLKIKSRFIINKILSNLRDIRQLNLIKYSKNLQRRLDIDYIKKYKTIEIVIIPNESFSKFINIEEKNNNYFMFISIIINKKKKPKNKIRR